MPPTRIAMAAAALVYTCAMFGAGLLEPKLPLLVGSGLLRLGSSVALLTLLKSLALYCAAEFVRLLPIGVLTALTLQVPRPSLRASARTFVLAVSLGMLALSVALAVRGADLRQPLQLITAAAALPVGAFAALSYRAGGRARRMLIPRLVAAGLLMVLGAAGLAFFSLEAAASLPARAPISSDQRRMLVRNFRGKDPRKVPAGDTRAIALSASDLDLLVQWGAGVAFHARSQTRLRPGGVLLSASLPVGHSGRWLNLEGEADIDLSDRMIVFSRPRLSLGRLPVPSALSGWLAALLLQRLQHDHDAARVLASFKSLSLQPEQAVLSYGKLDVPEQLAARLMWGEDTMADLPLAVKAHVEHLLAVLPTAPAGDLRFAQAMRGSFALARARSEPGLHASENRATLMALGIVLGHPKLARFLGERLAPESLAAIDALRAQTTLRGRGDWVRHFTVSGALTVISAVSPSDAAGLLKEELDADGGSGFSFADLLADRSGSTFAEIATLDEASAAALQDRLATGFEVDDFFPDAGDLPEGIPDADLATIYGGVGGPRFRQLMSEIERRVAACPAYRR